MKNDVVIGKNKMKLRVSLVVLVSLCFVGFYLFQKFSFQRTLRGKLIPSVNGETSIVFQDVSNGCSEIRVQGDPFPAIEGTKVVVNAGKVQIECNGGYVVEVPKGMSLQFDYWGP